MEDFKDVSPISSLKRMTVLSLASGNKLGEILDLFIDPVNGILLGVSLNLADGGLAGLGYEQIYSFGRDAVMVQTDESVSPLDETALANNRTAENLLGTRIVTESGDSLGQITNIFVTMKPPPFVLYEVRQSLLDKLLGREFFIPASAGHALSDDYARLVVPDVTAETAASDLATLADRTMTVSTFKPELSDFLIEDREDETVVHRDREDVTVVRKRDEDETLLREALES